MSSETIKPDTCQVDFYLLGSASHKADEFACKLAMMAWERKQKVFIIAANDASGEQLDELLWQLPEGRFLPHELTADPNSSHAPVNIGTLSGLNATDVVINLCPEVVPQPERFSRVLEIVPFADGDRQSSRVKYSNYRNLGLKPQTHEIGTV